ncbi:MAG: butyryl-CoA:acetate CoA-transferase [Lachnospiraceae bacterium]|nr:butyryl-CoA:acetate CoA-transferase [Lachnospiraceae bacterium]
MGYEEEYQQKLVSAQEAVKVIKSGDWVDYGWCVTTVEALDKALAERTDELTEVKLRGGILTKPLKVFEREDAGEHFLWNSWHMTGIERKMAAKGLAYYAPLRYSELPKYYRENIKHVDVAMFQVAPMDKHGYFNFGPSASHLMAVCEVADHIIVEVNQNVPRALGGFEEGIHISKVDAIVEGENLPLGEIPAGPPSKIDKKVAELIVKEIPNGACLQLGIGGMPNTVGSLIAESDLKDLGVHTEMYVDAFVDIAKAGKINGSKKPFDRFRQTYAFGAGTKKLYDYIDDNPECMSAPVDYTNDIARISAIDNFISINNAVNIDLFGQVNAESAGTKQISGAGGQLDFVMGAHLSKGGKSFVCLSSTYKQKDGSLQSRILPTLAPGSIVTDTRANTMNIVTEYGMVCLKGKSTWERAEALISIAHPAFREDLIQAAEKMGIWSRCNKRDNVIIDD